MNITYTKHALERMERRNLFPTIIQAVIEHGIVYTLREPRQFGNSQRATHAHISYNIADIVRGGQIGRRLIRVEPEREREYKHIIVLTSEEYNIVSAFPSDEKNVQLFLKKNKALRY